MNRLIKIIAKFRFFVGLLFFLASHHSFASNVKILNWGYVRFPPYHYDENSTVKGIIVDRIDYLFDNAKLNYQAMQLPNKRAKRFIDEGKVDFSTVIESFILAPNKFIRSKRPLYEIKLGAICSDAHTKIDSLNSLQTFSLIKIAGYTYGLDYELNEKTGFNVAVEVRDHEAAIKAISYQRAQCILGYESPYLLEVAKRNMDKKLYFHLIDTYPVYFYLNRKVTDSNKIMFAIDTLMEESKAATY